MNELTRIVLPNGDEVWAIVKDNGLVPVGARDRLLKLEGLSEVILGVTRNLRGAVVAARPGKASIEFGVEIALAKDGLIAALSGVSAQAAVKVTLEWSSSGSQADGE